MTQQQGDPQPAQTPNRAPSTLTSSPTMRLIGPLGTELHLPTSSRTFYDDRRRYGKLGFTDPQDVTLNPLELPRCMSGTFDWTLIGAREFTGKGDEGEPLHCVAYRGRVYKGRELPANKKLKLPEGDVKYSRGAREGEEDIAGGASGENKGYVTLAFFRTHAPPITEFCKPGSAEQARATYQADREGRSQMARASD